MLDASSIDPQFSFRLKFVIARFAIGLKSN
jgi:hypothetical protein